MKVLLLADVHSDVVALRNILNNIEAVFDVVVCVGDFTDFGPVSVVEEIVSELRTFLGFILTVPGNCDPPDVGGVLVEAGLSIAGKCVEFGGYSFCGVGGGLGGEYAVTEEDLDRVLRSVIVQKSVVISHMPPKGVCDGNGLGSDSIRKIVEEFKPQFVFCGHIHEAKGTGKIGESIVVNPGPVVDGNYALIDLETKSVELGVVNNEKRKTDSE